MKRRSPSRKRSKSPLSIGKMKRRSPSRKRSKSPLSIGKMKRRSPSRKRSKSPMPLFNMPPMDIGAPKTNGIFNFLPVSHFLKKK